MSDTIFLNQSAIGRLRLVMFGLVVVSVFSACDGTPEGRVPVHPVSGEVQFQGKPLVGAVVTFHPEDEAKYGKDVPRPTGRTNQDGKFELTTYGLADGAPVGSYLVAISTAPQPRTETGLFAKKSPLAVDILKGRYREPQKSGLKAEVKEGSNQVESFVVK